MSSILCAAASSARAAIRNWQVGVDSAVAKGFFGKDQFRYDVEADTYTCPGGAALSRVRSRPVRGEVRVFDYANAAACKSGAHMIGRCRYTSSLEGSPKTVVSDHPTLPHVISTG